MVVLGLGLVYVHVRADEARSTQEMAAAKADEAQIKALSAKIVLVEALEDSAKKSYKADTVREVETVTIVKTVRARDDSTIARADSTGQVLPDTSWKTILSGERASSDTSLHACQEAGTTCQRGWFLADSLKNDWEKQYDGERRVADSTMKAAASARRAQTWKAVGGVVIAFLVGRGSR